MNALTGVSLQWTKGLGSWRKMRSGEAHVMPPRQSGTQLYDLKLYGPVNARLQEPTWALSETRKGCLMYTGTQPSPRILNILNINNTISPIIIYDHSIMHDSKVPREAAHIEQVLLDPG